MIYRYHYNCACGAYWRYDISAANLDDDDAPPWLTSDCPSGRHLAPLVVEPTGITEHDCEPVFLPPSPLATSWTS